MANTGRSTGLLSQVVGIAEGAGNIIMAYYRGTKFTTSWKADASPVTDADLAASKFIQEALAAISDLPVLSEEAPTDYETRRLWTKFWLVDPLDGTKEFISGIDEFTVNISLVQHGVPILGVIYAPALGELYFGQLGLGAYVTRGKKTCRLPSMSPAGWRAITGRFHPSKLIDEFLLANNITDIQTVGSSLKFCRLAEGSVTIFPRYQGSMEWDIAAGHAIIKEAECYIIDTRLRREPLYNKSSMENDYFLACSNTVPLQSLRLIDSDD